MLRTLADIYDEQTLKDMGADYTLGRLSDVVVGNSVRRFDFDVLCEIHGGKRYEQIEGDSQICG